MTKGTMRGALLVATATGLLMLTGIAHSAGGKAVDAYLTGAAQVKLKVVRDDAGPDDVGQSVSRTYKFKPSCKSGPCSSVKVSRETASGSVKKYKLDRTKKGTYEGSTSYQSNGIQCARGEEVLYQSPGIQDETMVVQITKAKDGSATAIKGTLELVAPPLTAPITPHECAQHFAEVGLEAGDRAEEHATIKGKLKP